MLNLKKGLALVLAAATAFTFAPVSSLSAKAAPTTSSDGLTKSAGIDSIDFSNITLQGNELTTTGWKNDKGVADSKTILLQEHDNKSNNGTEVKGYRIKVERALNDKGDSSHYTSVIKVSKGSASDVKGTSTSSSYHAPNVTPDTSWGNTTVSGSELNQNKMPYDYSLVDNVAGINPNATTSGTPVKQDDATYYEINGAYVNFSLDISAYLAADTSAKSFKVTVYSLDNTTAGVARATELDKSEFTINLKTNGLNLQIDDSKVAKTVGEDTDIVIPYSVTNDNGSAKQIRAWGQTDGYVAQVYGDSDDTEELDVKATDALTDKSDTDTYQFHKNSTTISGFITVRAITTGTIKVNIAAFGASPAALDSEHAISNTQSFTLKITEGNGHLYVSYNTDQNGRLTFTDDPAVRRQRQSANNLIIAHKSVDNSVNADGEFIATKNYTTTGTAADTLKYEKEIATNFNQGVTDRAQTLVTNGEKTVQIEASAVPNAKISYSLVLGACCDSKAASTGKTNFYYSEKAAAQYGGVDQSGLVTIKKDLDDGSGYGLFVIVTAQGAKATETAAARKTSTFIIPVALANNTPAYVYVSDKENTADSQAYYNDNSADVTWKGTLYLSLKGRKSTTLQTSTNAGENYLKITSSDPTVVSVSGKTITALKAGESTITVQNSASPDVSGIAYATLRVIVNNSADTTAVSGKGVSVNKEHPYAQVTATSKPENLNVAFDTHIYKADKNYPSGYSRILPKDDNFGDITVTSTGHVAYQKNSGTVYVRAQVAYDDAHNPSSYVYIPVNYGQTVVDTELNVDQTPIVLDVKGTKQISATASSGASISYKSADPTVASVDEKGLVTANKSGYTTVTVTATSADGKTGDSAVITVIVKGNETITTNDVKKPSKVTGVKVKNKKGAKVSVTWKAQDKSVLYRVYKKVGNGSWKAKNVTGAKATLDVKKGAKVTVKVKAFRRDANGKAVWQSGKATKAKAFKTDKK